MAERFLNNQTAAAQTTDASIVTVLTVPIPTESTVMIVFNINAHDKAGNVAAFRRIRAGFRNDSGTVTQTGSTQTDWTASDSGMGSVAASFLVSGTDVLCRAQGVVTKTIDYMGVTEEYKWTP